MKSRLIRIERHSLGPRLHLLGRRVHEYHAGFAVLAVSPALAAGTSSHLSPGKVIAAIVGLWLVVKDWPDLFTATRDKAAWRLGLHRLPPGEGRVIGALCRELRFGWLKGRLRGGAFGDDHAGPGAVQGRDFGLT